MKKLVLFSLVLCGLATTASAQAKKGLAGEKSKSVVIAEKSVQEKKIPEFLSEQNSPQVIPQGRTKADRLKMKQQLKKD